VSERQAPSNSASRLQPRSGASRWVLRAGALCFLVGLGFLGAVFLPFWAGSTAQPKLAAVGTMLAPLGFGIILVGLGMQAAASNRAVKAALRQN
jgi:hypothetical protein